MRSEIWAGWKRFPHPPLFFPPFSWVSFQSDQFPGPVHGAAACWVVRAWYEDSTKIDWRHRRERLFQQCPPDAAWMTSEAPPPQQLTKALLGNVFSNPEALHWGRNALLPTSVHVPASPPRWIWARGAEVLRKTNRRMDSEKVEIHRCNVLLPKCILE